MGQNTPDRFPGPLLEEEIRLDEGTDDPSQVGAICRKGSDILARDGTGVFNIRTGGVAFDVDNCVIDVAGGLVYANDELVVTRV